MQFNTNIEDGMNDAVAPSAPDCTPIETFEEETPPTPSLADELTAKPLSKRRIGLVLVGLLLLSGLGFLGLRTLGTMSIKPERPGRNAKQQVTPVTVTKVAQKTVPIQLQAIGTVQASSTVAVTPQATGQVTGVYFQKGQDVVKGQLLFTLDSRTQRASIQQAQGTISRDLAQVRQAQATLARDQGLVKQAEATLAKDQAQVQQAEATLAKDQAQATYAQATSRRYSDLYRQGGISKDQAQQFSANSASSNATLEADRAAIANANAVVDGDRVAIENARKVVDGDAAAIANAQAVVQSDQGALKAVQVQDDYTRIYAPIDGRAGNILITKGNIVQANSTTPLVNLTKIRPIQVAFSVPESNLPAIQNRMENGRLKVSVAFQGDSGLPIVGSLAFLNNTVDSNTGTIQLIGDFDNTRGRLFPGQFVNTTLTLAQQTNATVVPSQAVQNGPNGQFVFVVKPDDTVENVPITTASSINGLTVIQTGLQPGQSVVLDGQANLVNGSKIRNKTAADSEDDFSNLFGNSSSAPTSGGSVQPAASRGQSGAAQPGAGGTSQSGARGTSQPNGSQPGSPAPSSASSPDQSSSPSGQQSSGQQPSDQHRKRQPASTGGN